MCVVLQLTSCKNADAIDVLGEGDVKLSGHCSASGDSRDG
jgi:hypothetical protein